MSTHRIRLAGPWEVTSTATTPDSVPSRVRFPVDWQDLLRTCGRTVRLSRKFHRPTNLSASEIVRLEFRNIIGRVQVDLNGAVLDIVEMAERTYVTDDIREALQAFNQLTLTIDALASPDAVGADAGTVAILIDVAIQ